MTTHPPYKKIFGLFSFILVVMALPSSALWANQHSNTQPNAGLEMRSLSGSETERAQTIPGLITANEIKAEITGPIVMLTIKQSFKNTSRTFMEGLYRFPLPDDASVHAFSFQVADRLTTGVVKEKKKAEKAYVEAVKAGKRAALLREHRPNVFSTLIGNIPPGETIHVTVKLVSMARLEGAALRWRLPMAIMPRYGDQQKGLAKTSDIADTVFLTAPDFYQLHEAAPSATPMLAGFKAVFHADEPINAITLNGEEGDHHHKGKTIALMPKQGGVKTDQDIVLDWSFTQKPTARTLSFHEKVDGIDYMMTLLIPPAESNEPMVRDTLPPRDLIFILDSSGSMHGPAMAQSKKGLIAALAELRPVDRFDIIDFDNDTVPFAGQLLEATADRIAAVSEWVDGLEAEGGTQMAPALKAALEHYPLDAERLQQVVFLTDGAVSEEAALFSYVDGQIGDKRLFTVGVGPAPNGWFMRKSAEMGRGSFTQIADLDDVDADLKKLMADIAKPRLTDLALSNATDSFPIRQPDMYGDQAQMIIYRGGTGPTNRTLTGKKANGASWSIPIKKGKAAPGIGLDKIWARKKIESLIDDRAIHGESDANRAEMVAVSIAHQVLSPDTRFIAIDQKIVRKPNDPITQEIIKGNLPKGAQASKLFAPQGALGLKALWQEGLLFSVSALLLLLLLAITHRRERRLG